MLISQNFVTLNKVNLGLSDAPHYLLLIVYFLNYLQILMFEYVLLYKSLFFWLQWNISYNVQNFSHTEEYRVINEF